MAIVARLLRGEPLELVARETNVSNHRGLTVSVDRDFEVDRPITALEPTVFDLHHAAGAIGNFND